MTAARKVSRLALKFLARRSTKHFVIGEPLIAEFQRLTEEGVCYVTKMKRNLRYEARRVEIFAADRPPVSLLTNNTEFTIKDVSEIYRLRWAIESLYKQLKQNFPLHFFYGDSENAIQIQTWVVLIANLLMTVLSRRIRRKCAFSQVVAMVRLTLMYYLDFVSFMENPDRNWEAVQEKMGAGPPPEPSLFD